MADLLQNSSKSRFETVIWTVKLALLSIGVISTFLLLKLAIPYSINLFVSTLPVIWIFFCSCLTPPYLYIVVNFIIISIAASSSFQQERTESKNENREEDNLQQQKNQRHFEASSRQKTTAEIWSDVSCLTGEKAPESDNKSSVLTPSPAGKSDESSSEIWSDIPCLTASDENLQLSAVTESVQPLPLDNSDTLDATWTAIIDARGKSLTRQLKKSDTWDTPPRVELQPLAVAARRELRKSDTFNDTSATSSSSGSGRGGLRREISLSQDDLNRRVEAFIQKSRLQRQESHKHYLAMLNRGCY